MILRPGHFVWLKCCRFQPLICITCKCECCRFSSVNQNAAKRSAFNCAKFWLSPINDLTLSTLKPCITLASSVASCPKRGCCLYIIYGQHINFLAGDTTTNIIHLPSSSVKNRLSARQHFPNQTFTDNAYQYHVRNIA